MKNYSIVVLGFMVANTYTADNGKVTASIVFYPTSVTAIRTKVVLKPTMTVLDVQEELRKQARNGSLKDSWGNALRSGKLYQGNRQGSNVFGAHPVAEFDDQGQTEWPTLVEEFGSLREAADRLERVYYFSAPVKEGVFF